MPPTPPARSLPPFFQNKSKRMIRFLLSACDADGLKVVAGRLALRRVLPPNVSPFGDITTDGGWSGLTGNQIWILSSILGLLFGPIFADVNSMVSAYCCPACHVFRLDLVVLARPTINPPTRVLPRLIYLHKIHAVLLCFSSKS